MDFYAGQDPYTYPNSPVLRNKFGLRDPVELARAERALSASRLLTDPPPETFDYTHFRAIHFWMFQDVYDWAGVERSVAIRKGDAHFAAPLLIRGNALDAMRDLRNSAERCRGFSDLLSVLAHFVSEMNVIHPFREGNGRVLREFLAELVVEMRCSLKAKALTKERWLKATIAGFHDNEGELCRLLADLVRPPAQRLGALSAFRAGSAMRLPASGGLPDGNRGRVWEHAALRHEKRGLTAPSSLMNC